MKKAPQVFTKKQAEAARGAINYPRLQRQKITVPELKAQGGFWAQYGVTQSGGSRYETGRDMDIPLRTLMVLHLTGTITDAQLAAAREIAGQR